VAYRKEQNIGSSVGERLLRSVAASRAAIARCSRVWRGSALWLCVGQRVAHGPSGAKAPCCIVGGGSGGSTRLAEITATVERPMPNPSIERTPKRPPRFVGAKLGAAHVKR
jgi:hypothetical protein